MEAVKYILKDVSSCIVSYMLCQPVEIDVALLLLLMAQYAGLFSCYHFAMRFPLLIQGLITQLKRPHEHGASFIEEEDAVQVQHVWMQH